MIRRLMLAAAVAVPLLSFTAVVGAQTAAPAQAGFSASRLQRVDQFIDRKIEAGEISGGVALVARNGRIVHLSARGVADVATRKPMQKDTIFRVASMSKPITAVAVMMLVEEGKLRLDDPVSKFLPSYRDMKVAVALPARQPVGPGAAPNFYTVPAERGITVLDLLTHSSGLMSGPNGNAGGQASYQKRHEIGLKWVDNLGTETALEFQPGTRWAYSPFAGLDVAARIVEIASGVSYDEFLRERLFAPLGMRDIFFWPSDAQRARLVTNYTRADGVLTPAADPDRMSGPTYFSGGAGLMSSAESYARFAMMLANGGELNGVRILSPAAVQLMGSSILADTLAGRPAGEGFGLAVRSVTDRAARRTLISNGSFGWAGAYGTHFWVDPAKKLTAILMVQTPAQGRSEEFETAVMQALMD